LFAKNPSTIPRNACNASSSVSFILAQILYFKIKFIWEPANAPSFNLASDLVETLNKFLGKPLQNPELQQTVYVNLVSYGVVALKPLPDLQELMVGMKAVRLPTVRDRSNT